MHTFSLPLFSMLTLAYHSKRCFLLLGCILSSCVLFAQTDSLPTLIESAAKKGGVGNVAPSIADSIHILGDTTAIAIKKTQPLPARDTLRKPFRIPIPTTADLKVWEKKGWMYVLKQMPKGVAEIFTPLDSGQTQNPNAAYKRSLLIPGWGQIYNRAYWKVPIVYAALGGLGYWAYFNHLEYKEFQLAYIYATDNNPNTNPESLNSDFADLPSDRLRQSRDDFRRNRDQVFIFITGAYALQVLEAYVNAHMKSFDVSEDLSVKFAPTFQAPVFTGVATSAKGYTTGIGVHFTF